VPTQTQNLAPAEVELTKEVEGRIAELNAPKEVKDQLTAALDKTVKALNDPNTKPDDRVAYQKMLDGINKTLKLIQDPKVAPRNRVAYTRILQAMDGALKVAQDPNASPEDRSYYQRLAQSMAEVAVNIEDPNYKGYPDEQSRRDAVRGLEIVSRAFLNIQDPKTKPKDPKDQEKIQKIVEENSKALVTIQDPKASPQDRDEAQKKLSQLAASPQNPEYLEFINELKRYNAPATCISTVEARTQEAGWPDGSLWGLADPACAAPLAAGAQDTTSRWNQLFVCVQQNPFTTCVVYIPKD
jgi:hypothetical protein